MRWLSPAVVLAMLAAPLGHAEDPPAPQIVDPGLDPWVSTWSYGVPEPSIDVLRVTMTRSGDNVLFDVTVVDIESPPWEVLLTRRMIFIYFEMEPFLSADVSIWQNHDTQWRVSFWCDQPSGATCHERLAPPEIDVETNTYRATVPLSLLPGAIEKPRISTWLNYGSCACVLPMPTAGWRDYAPNEGYGESFDPHAAAP